MTAVDYAEGPAALILRAVRRQGGGVLAAVAASRSYVALTFAVRARRLDADAATQAAWNAMYFEYV